MLKEQLEGLEQAQHLRRTKNIGPLVERTDKSKKRFANILKRARALDEVEEEYS